MDGLFDPSKTGLGNNTVVYTYTDINGCTNTASQVARVGTLIFMTGLGPLYCADGADVPFTYNLWMDAATDGISSAPVAGAVTDSDDGSLNATFHPTLAGSGNHTVTYTFTDEIGCINTVSQNVNVSLPVNANFSGLNAALAYCEGATNVTLTGNYAPGGTFTGPGGCITDNGNGTATFKPSVLAVGGPYTISYSYTNPSGCTILNRKMFYTRATYGIVSRSGTICSVLQKL
jgi:hypothetical protein